MASDVSVRPPAATATDDAADDGTGHATDYGTGHVADHGTGHVADHGTGRARDHGTGHVADDATDHARDDGPELLDVIELASAMLVRNFELLRRRSTVYSELDRAEYLLLRILDQAGSSDICGLAEALGLDPSTAGRQVVAMEAKSLVHRAAADGDRRRTIITMTGEGRRRMAATRDRRSRETGELLADWSGEDLRLLAAMFTRYNQALARRYLRARRAERPPLPVTTHVLLPES